MILVPASLIDSPGFESGFASHATIDGKAYTQLALKAGSQQSLGLSNGGFLSTQCRKDHCSVNIQSGSGNQQSVILTPGENGSYEIKYTSGGVVTESLIVTPISDNKAVYTTFDGAGAKVRESVFASGSLISDSAHSSAYQGPPLSSKLSGHERTLDAGAPPLSTPAKSDGITRKRSVDAIGELDRSSEREDGHKVITFLAKMNAACHSEPRAKNESELPPRERQPVDSDPQLHSETAPFKVSKLTLGLGKAATSRLRQE